MPSPERIYHGSIRAFSFVFIALGVVILATTLGARRRAALGGHAARRVFVAIGAGRLWIATRTAR